MVSISEIITDFLKFIKLFYTSVFLVTDKA